MNHRSNVLSRAESLALKLLVFVGSWAPLSWASSPKPPSDNCGVLDIFFLDARRGWVLADGLFKTLDGGDSWSQVSSKGNFSRIFFIDNRRGWAIAMDWHPADVLRTSLYGTTDGGMTWSRRSVILTSKAGQPMLITDFRFLDKNRGWFVGQGSGGKRIVLSTQDGGRTVVGQNALPGMELLLHVVSQDSYLWLLGRDTVLSSSNGGETWHAPITADNIPGNISSIQISSGALLKNGHGWGAGQGPGRPTIIETKDYGETWHVAFEAQRGGFFDDVSFASDLNGCAVTGSTEVYCTSDGGKSWREQSPLPDLHPDEPLGDHGPTRVFLTTPGRILVLSHLRCLYRSDDGGVNWRKIRLAKQDFRVSILRRAEPIR